MVGKWKQRAVNHSKVTFFRACPGFLEPLDAKAFTYYPNRQSAHCATMTIRRRPVERREVAKRNRSAFLNATRERDGGSLGSLVTTSR